MDPSAYMPREDWLKVLQELRLDEAALRDQRYDFVIHLVTAAKGAENFYSLDNNTVRYEGLELARSTDDQIMNAWNGKIRYFNQCGFSSTRPCFSPSNRQSLCQGLCREM